MIYFLCDYCSKDITELFRNNKGISASYKTTDRNDKTRFCKSHFCGWKHLILFFKSFEVKYTLIRIKPWSKKSLEQLLNLLNTINISVIDEVCSDE